MIQAVACTFSIFNTWWPVGLSHSRFFAVKKKTLAVRGEMDFSLLAATEGFIGVKRIELCGWYGKR